uniref:Uncharacterized protein n=1 Tax=Melopsittacus undulatus TaxID=13146 RepID=A0A8V5FPT3_MELUD
MRAGSRLPPRLLGCLLLGEDGAPCPKNWRPFRGYCYGFFQELLTWAEAEEECERYGSMGHLASIHSEGASNVLAAYLENQGHATGSVWIGLHDEEHTHGPPCAPSPGSGSGRIAQL